MFLHQKYLGFCYVIGELNNGGYSVICSSGKKPVQKSTYGVVPNVEQITLDKIPSNILTKLKNEAMKRNIAIGEDFEK